MRRYIIPVIIICLAWGSAAAIAVLGTGVPLALSASTVPSGPAGTPPSAQPAASAAPPTVQIVFQSAAQPAPQPPSASATPTAERILALLGSTVPPEPAADASRTNPAALSAAAAQAAFHMGGPPAPRPSSAAPAPAGGAAPPPAVAKTDPGAAPPVAQPMAGARPSGGPLEPAGPAQAEIAPAAPDLAGRDPLDLMVSPAQVYEPDAIPPQRVQRDADTWVARTIDYARAVNPGAYQAAQNLGLSAQYLTEAQRLRDYAAMAQEQDRQAQELVALRQAQDARWAAANPGTAMTVQLTKDGPLYDLSKPADQAALQAEVARQMADPSQN